jgi:DNA-binding CsgD family transcriptional regulator
MDASFSPISFNADAIQILSYPEKLVNTRRPDIFLTGKIRSSLISPQLSGEYPFVAEFRSGKRRYLCRAFSVDSHAKGPFHPSMALLLERDPCGLMALSKVSEQFHLTPREREALEHLVQGLSSKEIANRMNLSPNTVKTFLRLIMVKMGVSSRTAIVARITMTKPL